MAQSSVFPAHFRAEYIDNQAAFAKFEQSVRSSAQRAKDEFGKAANEMGGVIKAALDPSRLSLGKIDLGLSELREQAAQARLAAASLSETRDRARELARATGDTTRETQAFVQQLSAQAIEAQRSASAFDAQIRGYERLAQAQADAASRTGELAAAQRNLFAQQAAAARDEVRAGGIQGAYNDAFAPGLTRRASDNGATTGLLAELAQAQDAADRAAAEITQSMIAASFGIDRVTNSARESATAFDLLFQAQDARSAKQGQDFFNTALGIDRASKSARDSAAAFRDLNSALDAQEAYQAGAAQRFIDAANGIDRQAKSARESARAFEEMFAAQEKAERSQRELSAQAGQLRAQLDPMFAAQQRFDQELARADRLYEAGAISAREYANAQKLARDNLYAAAQAAVANNEAVERQVRVGTTATRNVINSLGAQRQAYIQSGQQLQDIAVQFQSGTAASIIFAQQIPQLGFALSGLEGQSSRVLGTLGRVGAFMAGPWGIAVVAAAAGAGYLVDQLFRTDDAAKDVRLSMEDMATGANIATLAFDKQKEAVQTLVDQTRALIQVQGEQARIAAQAAQSQVANFDAQIAAKQQEIARSRASERAGFNIAAPGFGVAGNPIAEARTKALQEELAGLQASRAAVAAAGVNAEIALSQQRVNEQLDAGTKAQGEFNRRVEELNRLRQQGAEYSAAPDFVREARGLPRGISQSEYDAQFRAAKVALDAAKEAAAAANRSARRTAEPQLPKVTAAEVARIIQEEFPGSRITQTLRDPNSRLGRANPSSLHNVGRGVDFIPPSGVSIDEVRAALTRRGVNVEQAIDEFKNPSSHATGGHFHVGFKSRRLSEGQIDDRQQKAIEAAQRETERLSRVSDQAANSIANISSQFDDQPRLIDRVAAANRKLADIYAELNDPANTDTPRRAELLAEIEATRRLVNSAVQTEIDRYVESGEKNLSIQSLLLQGREQEVEVLQRVAQITESIGLDEKGLEAQRDRVLAAEDALALTKEGTDANKAASTELAKQQDALARMEGQRAEIVEATESQVARERQINELLDKRREIIGRYTSALDSVRGELTGLLSGQGFDIGSIQQAFQQLRGQNLFDSLFGDAFDGIRKKLEESSPIGQATGRLERATDATTARVNVLETTVGTAATALERFGAAVTGATAQITGQPAAGISPVLGLGPVSTPQAANDPTDIVVRGFKAPVEISPLSVEDFGRSVGLAITGPLAEVFNQAFGARFTASLSAAIGQAAGAYLTAGPIGAGISALDTLNKEFGTLIYDARTAVDISAGLGKALGGAGTGYQIAGIGNALGLGLGQTGAALGGAIGSFFGPIGSIAGSILGGLGESLLGGDPKKKIKGGVSIGGRGGSLSVTGSSGLSELIGNATGQANEIISTIESIASQLGATVEASRGAVAIGQYKDRFKVNESGRASFVGQRGFADAESAVQYAIQDLIKDGVLVGLREGTRKLLQGSDDLEKALDKAVKFEELSRAIEGISDPLGAALRDLQKEFKEAIALFQEAGASQAEMAGLQELYEERRADVVREVTEETVGVLRDFLSDLRIGDNGYSIRDRLQSALTEYNPLAADIRAGRAVDEDAFVKASRQVLDLERELFGSQSGYFSRLDEITALTDSLIAKQEGALTDSLGIGEDLFAPIAGTTAAVEAMNDNIATRIAAMNDNIVTGNRALIAALAALNSGGGQSTARAGF